MPCLNRTSPFGVGSLPTQFLKTPRTVPVTVSETIAGGDGEVALGDVVEENDTSVGGGDRSRRFIKRKTRPIELDEGFFGRITGAVEHGDLDRAATEESHIGGEILPGEERDRALGDRAGHLVRSIENGRYRLARSRRTRSGFPYR